jgi:hypothetical protein
LRAAPKASLLAALGPDWMHSVVLVGAVGDELEVLLDAEPKERAGCIKRRQATELPKKESACVER